MNKVKTEKIIEKISETKIYFFKRKQSSLGELLTPVLEVENILEHIPETKEAAKDSTHAEGQGAREDTQINDKRQESPPVTLSIHDSILRNKGKSGIKHSPKLWVQNGW